MDIRNCRRCGRLYQYINSKYCPFCRRELDELFEKVRDYIYDNPDANVMEVSAHTGVEEDLILEFLREGRLELKSPSIGFTCEWCDRPITTGRLCSVCQREFEQGMKKGLSEAKSNSHRRTRDSSRMYVADFHKRKGRK